MRHQKAIERHCPALSISGLHFKQTCTGPKNNIKGQIEIFIKRASYNT